MAKLNKVFKKYGHDCEMIEVLDILPKIIRGNSIKQSINRAMVRYRLISEMHPQSKKHLRSQASINHEKYVHLTTYPNMIHPFSEFHKWWTILMGLVFFVQFIVIPIGIFISIIPGKELSTGDKTVLTIRTFGDFMCLIDIVINCFTGYYCPKERKVILSPAKILLRYGLRYFIIDLLSSIPSSMHIVFNVPKISNRKIYVFLLFSSLLKYVRINTFSGCFILAKDTLVINFIAYRTIFLITLVVIYYNFIASLSLFVSAVVMGYAIIDANATAEDLGNPSWITNDYLDGDTLDYYLISLFKTCTMIANAGFGDTAPQEPANYLLVIIIWLISNILFTLFVACLKQLKKALSSSHDRYKEMVTQLKEYMSDKEVPGHMQKRILMYYEFRFQKSYFRENEILNTISGQLRQEIILHNCRNLVEKVTFFKNLPSTLMIRITSCLYGEIFLPNDVIVYTNTKGNSMYFIATGTVAVYTAAGKEIQHLVDGDHFGEIALVMEDGIRIASVVAVEICDLYRLDRKDFIRAIHPYPDLYDKIQKIAMERTEKTSILDERFRKTRHQIYTKQ